MKNNAQRLHDVLVKDTPLAYGLRRAVGEFILQAHTDPQAAFYVALTAGLEIGCSYRLSVEDTNEFQPEGEIPDGSTAVVQLAEALDQACEKRLAEAEHDYLSPTEVELAVSLARSTGRGNLANKIKRLAARQLEPVAVVQARMKALSEDHP